VFAQNIENGKQKVQEINPINSSKGRKESGQYQV
jgi:hypothetical protein